MVRLGTHVCHNALTSAIAAPFVRKTRDPVQARACFESAAWHHPGFFRAGLPRAARVDIESVKRPSKQEVRRS